ncbi:hypothetical protein HQ865_13250 [Mucilaginibacter mali]|uniref:Uncharacterized protein n=1 Tax=Mucilaginibacter mali TaxID=2740462 RepID=A0A7D4UDK5_9SPHI|nr:hypothetical protein [Mucilaginibacter mali]QKJ30679.1 hypothetical protein HQ865_13250 [Mucilaginibacter mali]
MKNTDVFNDFDMVVSITEKTINDQLTHLLRMGTIHPELIIIQTYDKKTKKYAFKVCKSTDEIPLNDEGGPVRPTISVDIQPQVTISSSGKIITFIIKFLDGNAWFWDQPGPDAELVKYDAKGWQYAIAINMALTQLPKDGSGNIKAPDFVKNQLDKFTSNMFDISHLFMDFQATDLMSYDPIKTKTDSAGDFGKEQLVNFMKAYLTWLTETGNPYILGYSITQNDKTTVSKDEKVPDSLRPTGTTFTMFNDNKNPALSTLNFALVTKGGYGKIKKNPDIFDTNWISPQDQCDAKMIYAASRFSEEFVMKPLFNKLNDDTYNALKGSLTLGPKKSYQQARKATSTGYSFEIFNQDAVSDKYQNNLEVAITNHPAEIHYDVKGNIFVKKINTTNMGFCEAEASAQASTGWHANFIVKVAKDKDGNPALAFEQFVSIDSHNASTDKNGCAKFWSAIGDILDALLSVFKIFDLGSLTSIITNVFRTNIPGIGDINVALGNLDNSFNGAVMLPAGGVFFFKNPSADATGNVSLSLTYKTDSKVAATARKFQQKFMALKGKRRVSLAAIK